MDGRLSKNILVLFFASKQDILVASGPDVADLGNRNIGGRRRVTISERCLVFAKVPPSLAASALGLVLAALPSHSAPAARRFFFESWPNIDMSVAGDLQAVELEGKRLEFYDVGTGPTVLLVHGGRTDATDWREVITPLALAYRLIIVDGMVFPFDARVLWWLLDHLTIDKVALVGHSRGADICRDMYFMRPSRVWAFVNVDSDAVGGRAYADRLPNGRCSPQVQALHRRNDAELARLAPERVNDYPSDVNLARLKLWYRQRALKPALDKVLDPRPAGRPEPTVRKIDRPPAPLPARVDTSGTFKCPVLVFNAGYGKVDARDPPHTTEAWEGGPLRSDICEFVLVRDSGHWIWLDQPQIFLDRTLAFLGRYRPRPL